MSQARVGILLDLMNGEQVLNEIERIERGLKSLTGGKVRIDEQGKIRQLRKELERINADKHIVQVDTKSADAKIKRLKRSIDILNKAISTRRGAKGTILDERQIFKARTAVSKLNAELKKTQAHKVDLGAQYQRLSNEAAAARQQINLTNRALQNVKPISQIFNSATSKASHFGSALQSLGSAMGRVAMPVRMLTGGAMFAGMYKIINMAHEGFSTSLERYDTLENYAKSMAALGEDASKKFVVGTGKAMTAVENLNEAVLGLPTGLNEIVDMQKRFYSASNDMEKSTKMAIATNNAFLASGTDASEKLFGERQLRTLMSVGKLTTMQWASLQRTMPLAIDVVAKELGYADKGVNAMTADINAGKVSVDEFMDTLIRLGTSGTIADAANVMKHSFTGVQANIQNAFSRMGYNIVKTFDQIFQKAYGKDTIDMMYSFKDVIDKASEGIQNWIKANPDFFIDTLERLKNIDWKGFAQGFGEGIKTMVDMTLTLLEAANKVGAAKIGKFMAMSGMLSNVLTAVGGFIRGGRHLFGGSVALPLLLIRAIGGKGIYGKAFGKIKDMFKGITGIGKEAKTAEKAVKGSAMANLKGSFGKWLKPLAGIGSVLAIVAGTAGTIWVSIKAIKSAIKDMGEISKDVYDVDWDAMGKVADGFMGLVVAFTAIGSAAGRNLEASGFTALGVGIVGAITSMVAGFAALDIKLASSSMKMLVGITKNIGKIFDNIDTLRGRSGDKDAAKEVGKSMYGIYEAMFNTGGDSLSDIKWRDVKKGKKVINGFKDIFSSILNIQKTVDKLKDFKGLESGSATAIRNFMTSLGSIYDAMSEAFTDPKLEKNTEKFNTSFKGINGIFTSVKSLTDVLPKLYGSMQKALGSFNAQGRGATPFTLFKQQIKTLFMGINEIMTSLNEDLLGNGGENAKGSFSMKAMGNFSTIMQSVTETFASIKKLTDGLPALYESMTAMGMNARGQGRNGQGGGGMFDTLVTNVQNLFKGLGKMYQQMQNSINTGSFDVEDIEGKLSSIVNGITSIGKISSKLNELGGKGGGLAKWKGSGAEAAVNNIKSMISSLKNALGGEDLGGLKGAIENFVSSVKSLLDSLNNLTGHGNTVTVTITLKGVIKGKQAVINKISRAISDIRAKCKPVTITKTVNIKIRRHVSVGGDSIPSAESIAGGAGGGGGGGGFFHTGGYVKPLYRAKGGDVPKGTDTVPAWLTHGEFVQRRAAVDFWGKRFMQRINNLDVNGAMREMAARANRSMNINRGTTITNNTTNNNNVTQNVYTSNPNFARRRSNRFVAAL